MALFNFNQFSRTIPFYEALKLHNVIPKTSLFSFCNVGHFALLSAFWEIHTLECNSILVLFTKCDLIPNICIPKFIQLNIASKCFLFKTGYFVKMNLFSPYSWRMLLVLPTDSRLNRSHSHPSLVYTSSFCCPFPSQYYVSKATIIWSIQNTSSDLRIQENFGNAASWHSKFLSDYSHWFIFLAISFVSSTEGLSR